jgi:protocatechuate 3,4-dioxygenase beta subunit
MAGKLMSRTDPAKAPPTLASDTISRRRALGVAAKSAIGVIVSQSAIACGGDLLATTSGTTGATGNSATAAPSCVLTAALTEGPYFVDERLNRSDIRADPVTGIISTGVPLALRFNVSRVANTACTPLTGAYIDVWHCDAAGVYSDVSGSGSGRRFLRGYQITNADGAAAFTTTYPGWYSGRAVHVHFKLRLFVGTTTSYEFTSQFFFDESLTDVVHATSPYNTRGTRNTRNTNDGIYGSLTSTQKSALTLQTSKADSGYNGIINLGVNLG